MVAIDGGQAVEVNIGECLCPGTPRPHPDGDVVWLRSKVTLDMGLAVQSCLRQADSYMGDTQAAVTLVFVRYGPVSWNIVNEAGPVPLSFDNILDRLTWTQGGSIVANRARDLYQEEALDPLVVPSVVSPPPTHSNGSTSRKPPSGQSRPRSRRQSSPSGPVAGT